MEDRRTRPLLRPLVSGPMFCRSLLLPPVPYPLLPFSEEIRWPWPTRSCRFLLLQSLRHLSRILVRCHSSPSVLLSTIPTRSFLVDTFSPPHQHPMPASYTSFPYQHPTPAPHANIPLQHPTPASHASHMPASHTNISYLHPTPTSHVKISHLILGLQFCLQRHPLHHLL